MSPNAKNLVGTLLVALALFSVGGFVLPAYQGIAARRDAIEQRQDAVRERQGLISKVAKLSTDYQQRVNDARKFTAIVPATKSTAELVSELQAIAVQTGVQLAGVSLQEQPAASGKGGYRVLTLNADLVGSYSSLISFLGGVERSIRLLDVASIDAATGEGGSLLRFTVRATAYFLQ